MARRAASPAVRTARLAVTYRPPRELRPAKDNPVKHPAEQIRKLANNLRKFGFLVPILIDERDEIIAGHGRQLAAIQADLAEVMTITVPGLSSAQKQALRLADNRLAADSTWDEETLRGVLAEIDSDDPESLLDTGFGDDELREILELGDKPGSSIKRVETAKVHDVFWLTIEGPLALQAKSLDRLKAVMADLPGIEVRLGTVAYDDAP